MLHHQFYCLLTKKIKGDRSHFFVGEIETFNQQSLEAIKDYQLQRIRAIATYVCQKTIYCNRVFKGLGISAPGCLTWDEFETIPVLTKEIVREEGTPFLVPIGKGRRSGEQPLAEPLLHLFLFIVIGSHAIGSKVQR